MRNKSLKKPIKNGVARVPQILQMEALECGAASLTMILAYYEKWVPLEQVRIDCGVSRDGSNARNVLLAARSYGFTTQAFRMEPETLRENGKFPCIVHWQFNHFIVVDGFKNNKVKINDPARGQLWISMEDFDEGFTGIVLMFEPSEAFEPGGEKKSIWNFARTKLRGAKTAILFTILLSVITSLLGLINPAFQRIFMDQLLTGLNSNWLIPFFILFGTYIFITVLLQFLSCTYTLKLEGKMAVTSNAQYMWHVLRMPMEFFSQRFAGDISMRKMENETIAYSLIQTLAPKILDSLMMVFYLVLMLRYNVALAAVGILGLAVESICSFLIQKKQVGLQRVQMRDEEKLATTSIAGIEMIETIKASGAENGFFEKWAGYQASVNAKRVKNLEIGATYGLIPQLIIQLVNLVVLGTSIYLVIRGDFTVGMIMAFQSLLMSFSAPARQIVAAGNMMQSMISSMERIEDVMLYPVEVEENQMVLREDIDYSKLSGKIEMRNVTFGYSRLAEPLIENFNMVVEPGQKVAFVGSSGCGKSTLAKLLSGLYKPWSGEILFDGKPIGEIDRNLFTNSLAVVDQDITLFEDTISNNIKMWDASIEDYEMIMGARDASIHEDIIQRDGGYQYKILEGGKDFSGGQRQRLEIARVLAQDPTIIIMDEATSALDAQTEYEVVKAVKDRGITSIVIAHRLSTIRDCDEIIVMDKGKIVERGKHEELIANHGAYEELITSE